MDTGRLSASAESAATLARQLSHHGDGVRTAADVPAEVWSGGDAASAALALAGQIAPLYEASDAFRRSGAALEDLVDGLNAAKAHLQSVEDMLAGTGITISPDGKVVTPPSDSVVEAEYLNNLASQATVMISEALRMAEAADEAASQALSPDDGKDSNAIPDFFKNRFAPGVSVDKNGDVGLGLGEGKHRIGVEGPSLDKGLGPFSLNSGSIGLTDNPFPGVSLDRFPPKISAPFVDVSAPNVSIDFGDAKEAADDFFTGLSHGLRGIP